ncbi:zinc finger protein OZF-like [Trichogramma pretiosum]|uniref:zinc finger protein OZF-like n=1 Tax=Trichogramma pretiosum TaxID=7493 RepID=UPI0006C94890|nr:zinc finger protein OZF-like [Trichogramma pretiosum]
MENKDSTLRVKDEPNDTWLDRNDDNFNSVNSYKIENVENLLFHQLSGNHIKETIAVQEELDEKILTEFECRNVNPELKSLSTTMCKSENQSCPSIVKIENQIKTSCIIKKVMEGSSDVVRIKEKINDSSMNTAGGYVLDSMDYCKAENFETSLHESSEIYVKETIALQEELDVKIYIDFECRDVKPELKSSSTNICKSESQHFQSITKMETPIQTNEISKNALSYQQILKVTTNAVRDKSKAFEYESCHESLSNEINLNKQKKLVHNRIKSFDCETCHKSFGFKGNLNQHINVVHNLSKPWECDICHKSFGYQNKLKRHLNSVHNRSKPFECEVCHKSFGFKGNLNQHINVIHNRSTPFECDICHKSFGIKSNLNKHINIVHNRNKPFDCEICQKSFGQKGNLNRHVNAVHDERKPFECDTCRKSFGHKGYLNRHINIVHNRNKPFDCDICHKLFGKKVSSIGT